MAFPSGKTPSSAEAKGTKDERKLFSDIIGHYQMATEDLDVRRPYWDTIDELFRSYIDEANWPYNAVVFDPRIFTFITEKGARLFANKLKGRMVPREGGDELGARINNELQSFQWDDAERVDGVPMLTKYTNMDQLARKYGSSFALCKWRYERTHKKDENGEMKSVPYFDGPDFKVLSSRDVLANPSYSTIKNWFQYREYLTLDELKDVNDVARGKPIYKNLDILKDSLTKEKVGIRDTRASNYEVKNKTIKSLQDFLGRDDVFPIVEVVTEYRNAKWITFAPKHGIILRDIPNPYDHQRIPVVQLRYYPIDDDLYGLSEVEPVERIMKAINALLCQYLDSINMSLYTPLKVRASGVQMHTLEFGPGKKWIMSDPLTDVVPHEASPKGVTEFTSTYRMLVGALQEAVGETSAATSNIVPGQEDKTATEVRDTAQQRLARDNYNQIFLESTIKQQMMFWHSMDKQFMFSDPTQQERILRIVDKDASRYFQKMGLDKKILSQEEVELTAQSIDDADGDVNLDFEGLGSPVFPVETEDGIVPKFEMKPGDETGSLIMTPEDLGGLYDYIPDVKSMELPSDQQQGAQKQKLLEMTLTPIASQKLMEDGYKVKTKELMEDSFEDSGFKDADKYFEKLQGDPNAQVDPNGVGGPQAGVPGQGNGGAPGMEPGLEALAGSQAGPVVS